MNQQTIIQPLFANNGVLFEPFCSAFDCSEDYSSQVDSCELNVFEEAKLESYSLF